MPKFAPGDCLAVQLESGQYGAGLVLATDRSHPEYPSDLVADLDYLSDDPPTMDVFTTRNWLRLAYNVWQGLSIQWYGSYGFRKTKPRLTVVGNIPILATDPQQSSTHSDWRSIGRNILIQRERDAARDA